ncbi:DUF5081 family protein [Butyrivibrio hungatei]|uniref:DUF5081 family protein n=1 Tax=Butyrivibrio hungatei TaxID=185008 RepID=UPI0004085999|nr:DUF5081 family protein [Butyrivibrio hungatei]
MRFTSDELLFLNSITQESAPFGVFFNKIKKEDGKEKAEIAKAELIKKGIITDKGITAFGFGMIKIWGEYCNAYKYLVINRTLIGLIDERRCIVVYRDGAGYEIASGDKAEIIYACLKEYDFLRRADDKTVPEFLKEDVEYDDIVKKIHELGVNAMNVGVFPKGRKPGEEGFFYYDKKTIYHYNLHTKTERIVNPSSARKYLMEKLDINMEEYANG